MTLIPLISLTFTSCGDNTDEPDVTPTQKGTYSFYETQNFSKKWMVSSIKRGKSTYSFEYDAKNRPVSINLWGKNIQFSYNGNSCTLSKSGETFKGYFEGKKLIKAEWGEYTITNIVYDGDHLVKGSNGYRLTWDSNGNISRYSDEGMNLTYTEIPNKANIDFNMILASLLAECWCDDGSEYFTIFGWTGARTTNLLSSRLDKDGYHYEFSYIVDNLGRPIEIQEKENDKAPVKYVIEYVEN